MSVPSHAVLAAPPEPASRGVAARLHTRFDTIAPAWRALEAEGHLTVYQRADWAEGILAQLAGPAEASPLLVEVTERASGRPVMIWPLALVRRQGLRVVTWLDLGVSDYAAPLVADGLDLSADAAAAAWAAVRAVLPRADLIRIERIPAEIHGRPNPLASLPGRRRMAMQASGVAIEGDPDTLLKRLCRPSTLKDLGKQRRRLERAGSVRFARAETPNQVEALFSTLVAQRRRRFSEMGRFDLLAQPEVEAFYRARLLEGFSGGPARLLGLSVGDEVVAAAYGLVHRDAFHGILLTTSDAEAWRNASPGLQAVCESLRWARAEGICYFDFTVGDLPYKRDFGVQVRDLDEIVRATTSRGMVLTGARRVSEAMLLRLREHPASFERLRSLRRGLRKLGI